MKRRRKDDDDEVILITTTTIYDNKQPTSYMQQYREHRITSVQSRKLRVLGCILIIVCFGIMTFIKLYG